MKMHLRFIIYFISLVFLLLIYIGLVFSVAFDLILPSFGVYHGPENPWIVIFLFVFSFLSGGGFISWFLIKPLLFMISLINNLSEGIYHCSKDNRTVYTKSGRLKTRYALYKEVLNNIDVLAKNLQEAEAERNALEQSKRDWISGVSHDLKTPLSYIIGYAALLKDEEHQWTEAEKRSFSISIYEKGKYIEELIGDMNLSFKMDESKGTLPLHPTNIMLNRLLQNVIADISSHPDAAAYPISLQVGKQDVQIEADEKLLSRAFENLIMNAVRHNPEGTRINVNVTQDASAVRIRISDTGLGMEENTLQQIFNRYYQKETSEATLSSGLGLSIVKSIIEAHRGSLSVNSHSGKGTVFHIRLPYYYQA